jgi:hypothetical protein
MSRDESNARDPSVAVASTLLYLPACIVPGLRFDKDYLQVADGGRNRPLLAPELRIAAERFISKDGVYISINLGKLR